MADDTTDYIKSISNIPTDIPEGPTIYPGKPVGQPGGPYQRKSVVEEEMGKSPDYIAGEHNFKPVASVRFPDKNIHVVPLSNTKVRGVTPVGLSGSVTLPVRGERVFDLGDGIREPLEKRLGRLLESATTKIAGPTDLGQNASVQEASNSNAAYVKTELDKLRELAKQELSKRQGQGRLEIRPLNTHLGSVVADQTRPTPPVAVPTPTHTPTTTNEGPANEATSELMDEAQQLEEELQGLQQNLLSLTTPAQQKAAPITQPVSPQPDQVTRLLTDRAELINKINELALAYQQEEVLRKKAESKLYSVTSEFNIRLARLQSERDDLQKRVLAVEKSQADQVKSVSATLPENPAQVEFLKQQLASSDNERAGMRLQIQRLEALVQELGGAKKTGAEKRQAVSPQGVVEGQPAAPTARIVKPQIAVGRMAPSLTTAPNVINGLIKDSKGMLLSNAIIVVKNDGGDPVRALKTNKIGQFAISTPLPNGTYTMEIESPGHSFDLIQVDIKGQVMPPIEIRSHN